MTVRELVIGGALLAPQIDRRPLSGMEQRTGSALATEQ